MRQGDLTGLGNAPAADQAGVADRVVWVAERADGHQRLTGLEQAMAL